MTPKVKNIVSWILATLIAIAFFGAGVTKLIGLEMQIKNLESWGYPLWMRFPIGLGEIALAIGLLIPKFRYYAVLGIFPWALVAIYTHIQATPPQYDMLGGPIVFAVLATALFFVIKSKTK
jgi:putative oxidoreductase